ncbi:hypothetical protein CXG81DRAFT_27231 [Caulochytrium protostelioides]|uniref:GTP-binding protein n=1 Tax=Caulochytrium protostelioides TaxID=1555241 RepID=A0A4P9WYQ4_9FUNG|nr:ras-related GTP-binding protein A-like protein [Caulochytrium protostelioides]RKP00042.1 hypothetical protein CXG81DRAFT_27231 [Caulochytrium protostelioides]|eukprot:RKP00042.1 hypothetical protein CXG81DRAFT_27231 [Caulochytrium protostelioides]
MKRKVLLMGKSGSGKTSMRSIIFANYIARDTRRLGATIDVEHSNVRFLGNLVLNLWDCGGQDAFMEDYISSQRQHIFRNVEVLIYVFDIESRELSKDLQYYQSILEAIADHSRNARVFCLLHKMDLVPADLRAALFRERVDALRQRSAPFDVTAFQTSIWDETLYKAWSSIVYTLIPNVRLLEQRLDRFCHVCDADEIVLFERTTFLVISHATQPSRRHPDVHRFEKVSNIVKRFKLSCTRGQAQFQNMEICTGRFAAYIDVLTPNTYVMLITSDPLVQSATVHINIAAVRAQFEQIEMMPLRTR